MSDEIRHSLFPRRVLLGAATLLAVALAATAASRLTGIGTTPNPTSAEMEHRLLHFEDRPDGGVAVYARDETAPVEILEPGTNGFVRSVLRGLARERRARGVGSEPPFRLTRWADGRLTLDDPATGRTIELAAFGPTNAGAFAPLLTAGEDDR